MSDTYINPQIGTPDENSHLLFTDGAVGVYLKAPLSVVKVALKLVKADVGLDKADNTADMDKPLSNPQGVAVNQIVDASTAYSIQRLNHTGVQPATTIVEDDTHLFTTLAQQQFWNSKQAALESGVTIKTVGGDDILGSGDIPLVKAYGELSDAATIDLPNENIPLRDRLAGLAPMAICKKVTATAYTLLDEDDGNFLSFLAATPVTITVPPGLPVGFAVAGWQNGAGILHIIAGAGATLKHRYDFSHTTGDGSGITIQCTDTDFYNIQGDME